jgi:hypothetical protein
MVNQRQAPPRRSGGMLAGIDRLTLYDSVCLQGRDSVLEWPTYPASFPAATSAAVGFRVLDSEAMKTRLIAITINAFRTDPCQVIITFERSDRCRSFYYRPEEYGPTISRCSLGQISRTLRQMSESGQAAAAALMTNGRRISSTAR